MKPDKDYYKIYLQKDSTNAGLAFDGDETISYILLDGSNEGDYVMQDEND